MKKLSLQSLITLSSLYSTPSISGSIFFYNDTINFFVFMCFRIELFQFTLSNICFITIITIP